MSGAPLNIVLFVFKMIAIMTDDCLQVFKFNTLGQLASTVGKIKNGYWR